MMNRVFLAALLALASHAQVQPALARSSDSTSDCPRTAPLLPARNWPTCIRSSRPHMCPLRSQPNHQPEVPFFPFSVRLRPQPSASSPAHRHAHHPSSLPTNARCRCASSSSFPNSFPSSAVSSQVQRRRRFQQRRRVQQRGRLARRPQGRQVRPLRQR